jgi:hypothetical protein
MRFAYETADGVAIVTAAPKADLTAVLGRMTDEQYRQHVIERSIPNGARVVELPDDWTPPSDRSYRGAWKLTGGVVALDMPKARELFMARVRSARDKRLDELDRGWMKWTGQGNEEAAAKVEARRAKLRDLPQRLKVDEAYTVEALQALWPADIT